MIYDGHEAIVLEWVVFVYAGPLLVVFTGLKSPMTITSARGIICGKVFA